MPFVTALNPPPPHMPFSTQFLSWLLMPVTGPLLPVRGRLIISRIIAELTARVVITFTKFIGSSSAHDCKSAQNCLSTAVQKTMALLDERFKPVVQRFRTDREDNDLNLSGLTNRTDPKFFQN